MVCHSTELLDSLLLAIFLIVFALRSILQLRIILQRSHVFYKLEYKKTMNPPSPFLLTYLTLALRAVRHLTTVTG